MDPEKFTFNFKARLTRYSDRELLAEVRRYVQWCEDRKPTISGFDRWPGRQVGSNTITSRFGGWREALLKVGARGVRPRRYTPEMLMQNLEEVWRALGRRPGVTTLRRHGRYSADPYVLRWGSVRQACKRLAQHHAGKLTRAQLLKPSVAGFGRARRKPIRPSDRHAVLTRDGGKCVICGRGPGHGDAVKLEVDHIVAVSRGGGNEMANLRTLCGDCNRGKGGR